MLSQLLDLHLLDFVPVLRTGPQFKFIDLINAHLLIEKHGIHVVSVLVEPGLLDGSALQLGIDERAALPAALPLEAWLTNERYFFEWCSIGALATIAPKVLLRHFSPFSLAFLDDVHADLHPQTLLVLAELVVQWLMDWHPVCA